jgi:hypothetical protein
MRRWRSCTAPLPQHDRSQFLNIVASRLRNCAEIGGGGVQDRAGSPESDFAAAISDVREAAQWRRREARVEDVQVSLGDLS